MLPVLSRAARAGTALLCGLLVLAVFRWSPVFAEPPVDVRALSLAAPAILLAVVAGLTGRPRAAPPLRGPAVALGGTLAALVVLVAVRPPAGLVATVSDGRGVLGQLEPGPIDIGGADLRPLVGGRRRILEWKGSLHVSRPGVHRLWLTGRGRLDVAVDGWPVSSAAGDPLRAGADVPLAAGAHALAVRVEHAGPSPRLRLGWTRPDRRGRPGSFDDVVPPRALGTPIGRGWWVATDALALLAALLVAALVWRGRWDARRPPPSPRAWSAAEVGWSLAGHALIVAAMSWPLVLDPAGQGVTDRPDGRLNAWILAWDVHALRHQPGRLFQAPIFHPLPDALAFSENLLVPALLAAPGTWAAGPVFGYNLALVVSLVVSGLGAQALVRRASGDRLAAFVAGAFFAAGAHRWIRLAHLHAQVTLFLPFVLLALDRLWERPTGRRAFVFGSLLALQGLSSVYLGAITALVIAVALALAVIAGRHGKALVHVSLGLLLAALLLAPAMRPYLRMRAHQGVEFTLADVAAYATTLESYAASGTRLYGAITRRHLDPGRVQDTLFPGLTVLLLGLAGVAAAPRRYRAVAVAASLVAVVFSLGPATAFYRELHESFVLVRGVRALSRFSLVPVLALSVLAGLALARRPRLALLALAAFAIESTNAPLRYAAPPRPSEAAAFLRGRPGAVADLPLGVRDTEAMLDGIAHWRPLLNGDSGFMPRPYTHQMELLQLPPTEEALRYLRAVDVRDLVARQDLGLPLAARFGEERVYAVPPGDAAQVVVAGEPAPTLWTPAGAEIHLEAARALTAVAFAPADAPWVEAPVVEVSDDGRTWRAVPAVARLGDAVLSLMADPRAGRGEVVFGPVTTRRLRLDPRLPARPGLLNVR
jgi:hypothetical protein